MAYLIQQNADGSNGQQWDVGQDSLTVGRADDVIAKIADPKMSRHHFTILQRGEGHVIKDEGSRNGTFINDQPISETELNPNDRITAGDTVFIYQSGFDSMLGQLTKKAPSYSTMMRKIVGEQKIE